MLHMKRESVFVQREFGHLGKPLLDPCSPLPSCCAFHESSPKHVCSCQLPGVCVNVWRVYMYTIHVFGQRALLHISIRHFVWRKDFEGTFLLPLFSVKTNFREYKGFIS